SGRNPLHPAPARKGLGPFARYMGAFAPAVKGFGATRSVNNLLLASIRLRTAARVDEIVP
ncbi:MAG TPA: hypothetical protein VEH07_02620, partial [Alphaproteobacteria bacterium]|nr:hypothetical protein [Alphaproteobacteria bacterium]